MGVHTVRYRHTSRIHWGTAEGGVLTPLAGKYPSLADFLAGGAARALKSASRNKISRNNHTGLTMPAKSALLSPVTSPCQIVCQGKNYADHVLETGTRLEDKTFNQFFVKAASSLTDPQGAILRPPGVRLFDYELELALVIGRPIRGPMKFDRSNITQYVAGIVMANDVSARDIQIPQGQWFKGKSFRTFCPVGPVLYLFERGETIGDLSLELRVNGEIRQKADISQMIYPPWETLSELSGLMDLNPGDLVLTGTPGGVALRSPASWKKRVFGLLFSEKKMMQLFVKGQSESARYLIDGDIIESTIRSNDGRVDLGKQRLVVKS